MNAAARPLTVSAESRFQWCRSLFSGWLFPAHFYEFAFCLEHLEACQRFASACCPTKMRQKSLYKTFCPFKKRKNYSIIAYSRKVLFNLKCLVSQVIRLDERSKQLREREREMFIFLKPHHSLQLHLKTPLLGSKLNDVLLFLTLLVLELLLSPPLPLKLLLAFQLLLGCL